MSEFVPYICIALVAFAITFAVVPAAKRAARRFDAVDYPSKRRVNTRPVPRLGGIAVFCGLLAACAMQVVGTKAWGWPSAAISHPSLTVSYPMIAIAFILIFITGVADDIVSLSPRVKLIGQVMAAVMAASGGLTIGSIVNPLAPGCYIHLGWYAYPITVLYLVAYTNIINLIDGLDGLACGISAISSATMFSFAVLSSRADAAALAIALFGACLAFLRYNFHPASIFLGDSGSLVLGFALGSISLLSVSRTAALTSLIMPLIVSGVPIIDTLSAIIRRARAHVSIGQADKGHIHHRLIEEGYDQRQAVLLIYAWCILLSLGAITINQVGVTMRIVIFIVLLVCSAAFAVRLHLFEPVLRHHYNPKTRRDEIVSPDNPAFGEEVRSERREHGEHRHRRRDRDARSGRDIRHRPRRS